MHKHYQTCLHAWKFYHNMSGLSLQLPFSLTLLEVKATGDQMKRCLYLKYIVFGLNVAGNIWDNVSKQLI